MDLLGWPNHGTLRSNRLQILPGLVAGDPQRAQHTRVLRLALLRGGDA